METRQENLISLMKKLREEGAGFQHIRIMGENPKVYLSANDRTFETEIETGSESGTIDIIITDRIVTDYTREGYTSYTGVAGTMEILSGENRSWLHSLENTIALLRYKDGIVLIEQKGDD